MNLLSYILEANIYLAVVYAIYKLLFRKLKFHDLNRYYLLAGAIIPFIVPLLNFSHISATVKAETAVHNAGLTVDSFSWNNALLLLYLSGVIYCSFLFIRKLHQLSRMAGNNRKDTQLGVKVIYVAGLTQPFSFLKTVYLPEGCTPESEAIVMSHELIHAKGRHSVDIIILEVVKIISWFIPFVALIQREIKLVHEYIADHRIISKRIDIDSYINYLLYFGKNTPADGLTSGLNAKESLAYRIRMMYRNKENPYKKLIYLLPVLLFPVLVFAASKVYKKDYGFYLHSSVASDTSITKQKQRKKIIYYPIIADKSHADTILNKNGHIIIEQPLTMDTAHPIPGS